MKIYYEKDNPANALEGRQAVGTVSPKIEGEPRGLFVKNEAWEQLFEGCQGGETVTIVILRSHD
jgi:hypothetical protein